MEKKDKDWIKNLRYWVKFIPLEDTRSWIEKRLILEEQLLEQQQEDLLKLGEFLIEHPKLTFKQSLKEYLKILEKEENKPK